jgi:hypothetical protein
MRCTHPTRSRVPSMPRPLAAPRELEPPRSARLTPRLTPRLQPPCGPPSFLLARVESHLPVPAASIAGPGPQSKGLTDNLKRTSQPGRMVPADAEGGAGRAGSTGAVPFRAGPPPPPPHPRTHRPYHDQPCGRAPARNLKGGRRARTRMAWRDPAGCAAATPALARCCSGPVKACVRAGVRSRARAFASDVQLQGECVRACVRASEREECTHPSSCVRVRVHTCVRALWHACGKAP